ncbi:MAG: hypothetical protein OHK0046_52290 [Anaerolineae bacterium]
MTTSKAISPHDQLALLLTHGVDAHGRAYTVHTLAAAANLSRQALFNLLSGRTASPLLETARALCAVYGISLDYFDLTTPEQCLAYLERHRQQCQPLLQEIVRAAEALPTADHQRLASIVQWLQAHESQLSAQQKRKRDEHG